MSALFLQWDIDEVCDWLKTVGLDKFIAFFREHEIEGEMFPDLDHELLREMGVAVVGQRLKILKRIKDLVESAGLTMSTPSLSAPASPTTSRSPSPKPPASRREGQGQLPPRTGSGVLPPRTGSSLELGEAVESEDGRMDRQLAEFDFGNIEAADMHGWLGKQSGSVVKRVNKRFFVLQGTTLYYAKSDDAKIPIGSIALDGAEITGKREDQSLSIVPVNSSDRKFVLKAYNKRDYHEWHKALTNLDEDGVMPGLPNSVLRLKAQNKLPPDAGMFVCEGLLKKSPTSGKGAMRMRHFILFSNMLIYCDKIGTKDISVKGIIDMALTTLDDREDDKNMSYAFTLTCGERRFHMQAQNSDDKMRWMNAIEKTIRHSASAAEAARAGGAAPAWAQPVIRRPSMGSNASPAVARKGKATAETTEAGGSGGAGDAASEWVDDNDEDSTSTAGGGSTTAGGGGSGGGGSGGTSGATVGTDLSASSPRTSLSAPKSPSSGGSSPRVARSVDGDRRGGRALSMRSKVDLDKDFPKPPMPNCVRAGTFNISHPVLQYDIFSKWDEQLGMLATSLRFHNCDVLNIQSLERAKVDSLIEKMQDFVVVDYEVPDGVNAAGLPLMVYFRWRLTLTSSGIRPLDVPPSGPGNDAPWVLWVQFQDVFTEYSFFMFNTDWTNHSSSSEERVRNAAALKAVIAEVAGTEPFVVAISGNMTAEDHAVLCDPFAIDSGAVETALIDSTLEDVDPGHEHIGPFTTWAPCDDVGMPIASGASLRDFLLVKAIQVETLNGGVTQDRWVNGRKASLHDLLIADLIIDPDAV